MAQNKIEAIQIAKIHANGVSLGGLTAEITLPNITAMMGDYTGLGLFGSTALFTGVEKLEGSIKFNTTNAVILEHFGKLSKSTQMQCRSVKRIQDANGITAAIPVIWELTIQMKSVPMGTTIKAQELASFEAEFVCNSLKCTENGVSILEIDVAANIYKINGVDEWASVNSILG